MLTGSMDRDDLDDAISGALDLPRGDYGDRRSPGAKSVARLRGQFRRILAELPDNLTVRELHEMLEPGDPDPDDRS